MMNSRVALQSATRQFHPILSAISQTTIRPELPTPHALKTYNLSPIDICTADSYIPLVLFFPCSSAFGPSLINKANNVERLKRSLAQTLTTYYPFAGRMSSSGSHISCNDHGAQFVEAQVNCSMSDIIENRVKYNDNNDDSLCFLFPPGTVWDELNKNDNSRPLMAVQLNHFDCGGIALAVSLTHRLTDGCGLCTFLQHWAAVSSQSGKQVEPYFHSWPSNDSGMRSIPLPKTINVARRFEFKNSSLTSIRAQIGKQGLVENPTRVEVLSALLYRASLAAATESDSTFTPSVLFHLANVRPQLKIPMNAVGNHYWTYVLEVKNESEVNLSLLTKQIRRGKMELMAMEASKMNDGKNLIAPALHYSANGYKIYICSSLCNFPFHKMDFGWGRASKVCIAEGAYANHLVLTDTADGIEAMVCLEEDKMPMFENNEEILAAATSTTCTNNVTGV